MAPALGPGFTWTDGELKAKYTAHWLGVRFFGMLLLRHSVHFWTIDADAVTDKCPWELYFWKQWFPLSTRPLPDVCGRIHNLKHENVVFRRTTYQNSRHRADVIYILLWALGYGSHERTLAIRNIYKMCGRHYLRSCDARWRKLLTLASQSLCFELIVGYVIRCRLWSYFQHLVLAIAGWSASKG